MDVTGVVAHGTLLSFDGRLRADEVLQRRLRSLPNARVIVSAQITAVRGTDGRGSGLRYTDRGSGEGHRLNLDDVFVESDVLPNTHWLNGTVVPSPRGEIEEESRGATSLLGMFAAGDATTVRDAPIIIAPGEGSKAALGPFDHLLRTAVPGEQLVAA